MSRKLKVGQNVRVKETGEIGVIKGREVIPMQDKHIKVQYVIKLGEGIANWKAFDKKDIELVVSNKNEYPKMYTKRYTQDGRDLTLVGIVDKDFYNMKNFVIGHALRHPHDEVNMTLAYRIAKRRAWHRPVCNIVSYLKGEFKDETVNALMDVKAKYIFEHLENFVREEKED